MTDHQHLLLFDLVRSRGEQIARDSGHPGVLAQRELMTTRLSLFRRHKRRVAGG